MLRRVLFLTIVVIGLSALTRSITLAKGAIAYFTVGGAGILEPIKFTADLNGYVPFDHEHLIEPAPQVESEPFTIRAYTDDGTEHLLSPLFYYPQRDGTAYVYFDGSRDPAAFSLFAKRWFYARPIFVEAAQQAIRSAYPDHGVSVTPAATAAAAQSPATGYANSEAPTTMSATGIVLTATALIATVALVTISTMVLVQSRKKR